MNGFQILVSSIGMVRRHLAHHGHQQCTIYALMANPVNELKSGKWKKQSINYFIWFVINLDSILAYLLSPSVLLKPQINGQTQNDMNTFNFIFAYLTVGFIMFNHYTVFKILITLFLQQKEKKHFTKLKRQIKIFCKFKTDNLSIFTISLCYKNIVIKFLFTGHWAMSKRYKTNCLSSNCFSTHLCVKVKYCNRVDKLNPSKIAFLYVWSINKNRAQQIY